MSRYVLSFGLLITSQNRIARTTEAKVGVVSLRQLADGAKRTQNGHFLLLSVLIEWLSGPIQAVIADSRQLGSTVFCNMERRRSRFSTDRGDTIL